MLLQWPLDFYGVSDGTWTHDNRGHNPVLYHLSYTHHVSIADFRMQIISKYASWIQGEKPGIDANSLLIYSFHARFRYQLKQIWVEKMSQFQIFVIRAIIGLVAAVFLTRMFYGRIDPLYIAGLAIILVGLAYFSEYLRKRRSK